jgi:hypothetical protein
MASPVPIWQRRNRNGDVEKAIAAGTQRWADPLWAISATGAVSSFCRSNSYELCNNRHDAVHLIGIRFGPLPAIHPSHRHAKNCMQVLDPEGFGHATVLQIDNVLIPVFGKFHLQPITWLTGFPMPDIDQLVFARVEWANRGLRTGHER